MLASNSASSFSFLILPLILSPTPLTDITHICAAVSLLKQRAFLTPDCLLQSKWQYCCIMTDDASNCPVLRPVVKVFSVYAFVHVLVSAPYNNTDIMKVSNTHIFHFLGVSHFQSLSNCYIFLAFFIISIIFFCTFPFVTTVHPKSKKHCTFYISLWLYYNFHVSCPLAFCQQMSSSNRI